MTTTFDPSTFDRKAFLYAWAEDLESGRFTQGTGYLRQYVYAADTDPDFGEREIRHCCLGVACDRAVDMGILERMDGVGGACDYGPPGLRPGMLVSTTWPVELAELLTGERWCVDPQVFGLDGGFTYSEVNDTSGTYTRENPDGSGLFHMSFPEIAVTIRAWADSLP